MRIVSIERGRDPRRYALVGFGGAGPLHACRLARTLEIPRVIVPRGAGVGSAIGLLTADRKMDFGITRVLRLNDAEPSVIAEIFGMLEQNVMVQIRRMQRGATPRIARSASMRYAGQGYEIQVELPVGEVGSNYPATALAAFHAAYQREYGYNDPQAPVEVSDWCAVATLTSHADASFHLTRSTAGEDAITGHRLAYFPETGGMTSTRIVNRYALTTAHRIAGPALVEERESTTVVLPGDVVSLSAAGNLIIDVKADA